MVTSPMLTRKVFCWLCAAKELSPSTAHSVNCAIFIVFPLLVRQNVLEESARRSEAERRHQRTMISNRNSLRLRRRICPRCCGGSRFGLRESDLGCGERIGGAGRCGIDVQNSQCCSRHSLGSKKSCG